MCIYFVLRYDINKPYYYCCNTATSQAECYEQIECVEN